MKTKILISIILISIVFPVFVIGQENSDLPNPGLTPDSPFYFLDTIGEKIGMFFTFGAEKKAEKALKFAEEKLAEAKVMAEKNKAKAIERANQGYQKYLGLANEKVKEAGIKGKDVEWLVNLIKEKTLRHQEILSGVLEKVPEEAKSGIEKAIEMSKKGYETAIEAVSKIKEERERIEKEAVPEEKPEEVPPEKAAVPKEEYAEFTLTFPYEEKMDFQAKTIFIAEEIFENVPFIQIGLFGESPIIAPYVQMGQLEEFLSTISLNGMIDNIKKKEEETREAKGVVVITVKKPDLLPQKVICNLEEDSLCGITTAKGAYQIAAGEPYGMSFGGGTFYFKENNIIEGEIDAYYSASISGKFRIKIRKGVTLIEKEKLIEEAERQIKEAKEIQEKEKEISDRDRQRTNDIMLISEVLERYYRDQRKYFQSKTMPIGIEPYYLVPALKDPLTGNPYNWLDNTPGALTGCDDQRFCLWAELEKGDWRFKVASEIGVTQLKTQPTKCPCHP